jgi:hypothetical protein
MFSDGTSLALQVAVNAFAGHADASVNASSAKETMNKVFLD